MTTSSIVADIGCPDYLPDIAEDRFDRSGIKGHIIAIVPEFSFFRNLNGAAHPAFMLADPYARRIVTPCTIGRAAARAYRTIPADVRFVILAAQLFQKPGPHFFQVQLLHHPLFFFG